MTFSSDYLDGEHQLGSLGTDGKIILNLILSNQLVSVWTGFIWHNMESKVGIVWKWLWKFGFQKEWRRNSWSA